MTDSEPELYVPKPGSVPWRVLKFLVENPDEQLTRGDVAVKFDCVGGGTDTMLQLAVARECLKKSRNSKNEMIWILGLVKRFRLDPLPSSIDDEQVAQLESALTPTTPAASPAAAPPPAPAPAAYQAIKVARTEPVKQDTPEGMVEEVAAARVLTPDTALEVKVTDKTVEFWTLPTQEPVTVAMPLHLTPELIEAVRTDPSTSFENKADGHHAIGWLHDAYKVMVKRLTTPQPTH